MRIALAALRHPDSVSHGVEKLTNVLHDCGRQKVDLVCFPETYLPGLRGADVPLPPPDQPQMEDGLRELRSQCRRTAVAAIVGLEWMSGLGLENRAVVLSASGRVLGHQTKNQITPGGESDNYVPDGKRKVFRVQGTVFGVVICHEGWRYPETVRWAAVRGARIVFQPQVTGTDSASLSKPTARRRWGDSFYEKAMICRAQENSIYFASVNQAMRRQNSATSLIIPRGELIDSIPYGKEDVLIVDIDPKTATRFYARRYRPERYPE